jgi:hypothetical protein
MATDEQLAGAAWVLEQALEAEAGTSVLVIHDDATAATANCFREAARARNIRLRTLLVTTAEQEAHSRSADPLLDLSVRDEIDKVTRIVVLQEWRYEVTSFRFSVLKYGTRARGKRVASMPGVSLDTLHLCSGDLDQLTTSCRLYADRLIWGSELGLVTTDGHGTPARLVIPIGEHTPRTSTGRVPLWGWCNVPSGETFIVPDDRKSHGSVFINGSVPTLPVPEGHWMRMDVTEGRVRAPVACSEHEGLHAAAARYVYDAGGSEVATNCTVVSELGIGLNPWINVFTGTPLFDEKIAGTVHLGLGSSTQFEVPTECRMHNDFVIRGPSLWIDNCRVVDAGTPCLTPSDVFPHWSAVPGRRLDPRRKLVRTGVAWKEERKRGRILAHRQWYSDRSEGPTSTQVGDDETAALATRVLWVLEGKPGDRLYWSVSELRESVDALPDGAIDGIFELLLCFRLVVQE